jgi:hypothetical protein
MATPRLSTAPGAIVITDEELLDLVSARVDALLTPAKIEQLAAARIDARIKRLTLAEAATRLGCRNDRQVKDKCRALKILVRTDLGQKSPYILLADIEAANQRSVIVSLEQSTNGTRIASTAA